MPKLSRQALGIDRPSGCMVAQLLASLDDGDRELLTEALATVSVSTPKIITALKGDETIDRALIPGRTTMVGHRAGACACPR